MNSENFLNAVRSASMHKEVVRRIYPRLSEYIGRTLYEIVIDIENEIRNVGGEIAFPVGIGVNEYVAHDTPQSQATSRILRSGDLLKIDFGVHYQGSITDSAFTRLILPEDEENSAFTRLILPEEEKSAFTRLILPEEEKSASNEIDEIHHKRELIRISQEATMIGVRLSGIDVRLREIGEAIGEYIESQELAPTSSSQLPIPLKTFRDLCGHSIAPYRIHAGKAIPNCKIDFDYEVKMALNEKFAIEPFITTGEGSPLYKHAENNHFMIKQNHRSPQLKPESSALLGDIARYYKSLPFTERWLRERDVTTDDLDDLVEKGILDVYPPIYDVEGSLVAHTEHNVFIRESGIIHLTKNPFY